MDMLIALVLAATQAPRPRPLPPSSPEAVQEMYRVGHCIAEREARLAGDMLSIDFTTPDYRRAMDRLIERGRVCLPEGSRMRFNPLLFAGAVAERLLEREPTAVNVQLARRADRPAVSARSPSDRLAICVVRSAPDEVGRLFAAEPASAGEGEAADGLATIVRLCSGGEPRLDATATGLRAMLATAAFRTVLGAPAE